MVTQYSARLDAAIDRDAELIAAMKELADDWETEAGHHMADALLLAYAPAEAAAIFLSLDRWYA